MSSHFLNRSRRWPARAGVSWIGISGVMTAFIAVPLLAFYVIPDGTWTAQAEGPLTEKVKRAPFIHELSERGDVESSSTIDVRCRVQSRNSGGTALLEIVAEGTRVKEGDVICKLDSSALENERDTQQIAVNGSSAALIGATATLATAKIAKQEYLEGTFKNEEKLIQSETFVAEQNLKRAIEYLKFSEKLAARGFVSPQTLEADQFAVEKAHKDLEIAKTKLKVLQDFTKAKMLNTLEAAIETAAADLAAKTNINNIDKQKLEQLEAQVKECTVLAPQDGEVTYANSSDMRDSDAVIIKEGVLIRDRQAIVRLPDPTRMQVNAKVNEAKIRLIQRGMPAVIKVEALAGQELEGVVAKVMPYANRSRWSSSTVKEFSVIVDIKDPPADLRTGSSAEVRIRVNESPSELLVPVQAVLEHNGKHYCVWNKADGGFLAKEVEIGATNDSQVVIKSGVTESDQVVMNPRAHLDDLNLPELPAKEITAKGMIAGVEPLSGSTQLPNANASSPPPERAPSGGGSGPGNMLQNLDKNGDGRLSQDEVTPQMASRFATGDKNGDGFLDADEISAMPRRRPGGPGGPGGSGQGQNGIGGGAGE